MKKTICLAFLFFQFAMIVFGQQNQFTVVERNASVFPGGSLGWIKYIEQNLNRELGYRYIKKKSNEQNAKQTVQVSFDIDTLGHTSNIKVDNLAEVHPELAKEAVRVVTASPLWKPATENGKMVVDRRKQKITFMNGTP